MSNYNQKNQTITLCNADTANTSAVQTCMSCGIYKKHGIKFFVFKPCIHYCCGQCIKQLILDKSIKLYNSHYECFCCSTPITKIANVTSLLE